MRFSVDSFSRAERTNSIFAKQSNRIIALHTHVGKKIEFVFLHGVEARNWLRESLCWIGCGCLGTATNEPANKLICPDWVRGAGDAVSKERTHVAMSIE